MRLLFIIPLLLTGCTITKMQTDKVGKWSFNRWSLFQKVEVPSIQISPNGTVTVKGYKNDGGNEALGVIAEGMAKGVVEGMKP